jgi:hypothetical protein
MNDVVKKTGLLLAGCMLTALPVGAQEAVEIGRRRECFFDTWLLDMSRTTTPSCSTIRSSYK